MPAVSTFSTVTSPTGMIHNTSSIDATTDKSAPYFASANSESPPPEAVSSFADKTATPSRWSKDLMPSMLSPSMSPISSLMEATSTVGLTVCSLRWGERGMQARMAESRRSLAAASRSNRSMNVFEDMLCISLRSYSSRRRWMVPVSGSSAWISQAGRSAPESSAVSTPIALASFFLPAVNSRRAFAASCLGSKRCGPRWTVNLGSVTFAVSPTDWPPQLALLVGLGLLLTPYAHQPAGGERRFSLPVVAQDSHHQYRSARATQA